MLKKFSVSNFKCFNKRITFDLSDPANYSFNQQVIQDGIKARASYMVRMAVESPISPSRYSTLFCI